MDVNVDMSGVSGNMKDVPPPQKFDLSSLTTKVPKLNDVYTVFRANLRPWSEFLNFSNFRSIGSFQRLSSRFLRNLSYFQMNYVAISFVLILYCLITSPLILIVMAGSMYACYRIQQIQQPIVFFGKIFNKNQVCIAVNIATIPILHLFGAGSILFWVLGASTFIVALHAMFYNIDAIVTEEFEAFLSPNEVETV